MNTPFGIRNGGNTCYMNALLQALLCSTTLVKTIVNGVSTEEMLLLHKRFQRESAHGTLTRKFLLEYGEKRSRYALALCMIHVNAEPPLDLTKLIQREYVPIPRQVHVNNHGRLVPSNRLRVYDNVNHIISMLFPRGGDDYATLNVPDDPVPGYYQIVEKWRLQRVCEMKFRKIVSCMCCPYKNEMDEVELFFDIYDFSSPIVEKLVYRQEFPHGSKCENADCPSNSTCSYSTSVPTMSITYQLRDCGDIIMLTFPMTFDMKHRQEHYVSHERMMTIHPSQRAQYLRQCQNAARLREQTVKCNIPMELVLPHMNDAMFRLCAIVCYREIGGSRYGSMGHYWCVGKRGNTWYKFNDAAVSECTDNDVIIHLRFARMAMYCRL